MSFIKAFTKALFFLLATVLIVVTSFFLGIVKTPIPISGTSMLPTLPEEGEVYFQKYIHFSFGPLTYNQRILDGDLVVFENNKTKEILNAKNKEGTGFVKRVVAREGETVEIRDGFVYRNGNLLLEPFTLKPHSTFGGGEIEDCQTITVPTNHLFVLGDNRKISLDSRTIGLIHINDVTHKLSFQDQEKLHSKQWRSTENDLASKNTSEFDRLKYLELLNSERTGKNLKPLRYDTKLEKSAEIRASQILSKDPQSTKEQNETLLKQSLVTVGYSNTAFGEVPTMGYYTEQELFDALLEQPDTNTFLLNDVYEEVGISTYVGVSNKCPVQIVVQHFGGYIPPNYSTEETVSWEKLLEELQIVQAGWEDLKNSETFYNENKDKIDRITEIISARIVRAKQILKRHQQNEWLSEEENGWIEEESALSLEQNQLAEELNTKLKNRN